MASSSSPRSELEVAIHEVSSRHARGEIQLIDVREGHEFAAGRIGGAVHLPLGELQARADLIDPSRPVVFYCRVGARSYYAARAFRQAGYDAASMAGGLLDWAEAGLPLVPEGGRVAGH